MPKRLWPHLHRETTRHGVAVWYVRLAHGRRIRIRAEFGTDAFRDEYAAAISGQEKPARRANRRTVKWGLDRYRKSPAWAELKAATRRQRENIYRAVIAKAGDESLADITEEVIRESRDERAAVPHSANNFMKAMRGFFGWAVSADGAKIVEADPTRDVGFLKGRNDAVGFHTWTEAEMARFEARWPLGTRERLAFDLLLYTGLRRGDVVRLGPGHLGDDGMFVIRAEKTESDVHIDLIEPLAASINATKTGDKTFLVTEAGNPFVKEGFGNWFREVCRAADCPGSAHGLRKAGATRAANNGATDRQLMALYGWSHERMATTYTKAANKRRLAKDAAKKLLPKQETNEKRPHLNSSAGDSAKSKTKSGA